MARKIDITSRTRVATLEKIARDASNPQREEAQAEIDRRTAELSGSEHDADPKVAAAAVDAPKPEKAKAARVSDTLVARAVELRQQGLGLVKLTRTLTEEGHRSATGKELRPQTVRQWLLKALSVDHLREPGVAAAAGAVAETGGAEEPQQDDEQREEGEGPVE